MRKPCRPIVVVTRSFLNNWSKLTTKQQKHAREKVALLAENYRHSSLRTHPLHRTGGRFWSCSLSKTERLIYSRCGTLLVLHYIGKHEVVDFACIHSFSFDKHFMGFDQIS